LAQTASSGEAARLRWIKGEWFRQRLALAEVESYESPKSVLTLDLIELPSCDL
jgi:hypothetical protein